MTLPDLRDDPDYAGGRIGLVLTKEGEPVYYTEPQRNAECTQCEYPGHWIMALIYSASALQATYYVAFEDWEGANQETWLGNDGDFND